jgi:hypothetical protein
MIGCLTSVNSQSRQIKHAGHSRHTMSQSHGITNTENQTG